MPRPLFAYHLDGSPELVAYWTALQREAPPEGLTIESHNVYTFCLRCIIAVYYSILSWIILQSVLDY